MAISESKKKIVIDNYFKRECDVNTSIKEAFIKGFELGLKKAPIPSAESYKGMTNGDMIKAMFPKREVIEHDTYIEVAWGEKWIPCSERLPNEEEYKKNNGIFNVTDGNRSYSEWFDIYDKQRFGEPTIYGFRVDYAVTAWMPLPEPYKAESEDKE